MQAKEKTLTISDSANIPGFKKAVRKIVFRLEHIARFVADPDGNIGQKVLHLYGAGFR